MRDYIAAHAAMYDAIKAADTVDADGDGVAAAVGLSSSVAEWEPRAATCPRPIPTTSRARDRLVYVYHYLFVDALLRAARSTPTSTARPTSRTPSGRARSTGSACSTTSARGVTGDTRPHPGAQRRRRASSGFDFGACLPPLDPTFCVPQMGYEYWPDGLYDVLEDFGAR